MKDSQTLDQWQQHCAAYKLGHLTHVLFFQGLATMIEVCLLSRSTSKWEQDYSTLAYTCRENARLPWSLTMYTPVEGSQPEWCISSMIYSRDTPFWSETLVSWYSLIAKLRRTYPCGNVKSNCNFVFHNGERKEITWERKRAQVIFKDVQMVQTLERKERTGRENRQTAISVHNHITFRVWHVISFLSPLWKTKLQLDFTLPQG